MGVDQDEKENSDYAFIDSDVDVMYGNALRMRE